MAKQTITDETVAECVSMARDAAQAAQAVTDAIRKTISHDELPIILRQAQAMLAASRDLSECALALLDQNRIQEQRREIEENRAELAELRKE